MSDTDTISHSGPIRSALSALTRASQGNLIKASEASHAWGVPSSVANARLHRMVKSGWILAVRKGLFYILPLEASSRTTVDDPWILASLAFQPCYIGGWTAAEHWGLTEQIFRSTFVVTANSVRAGSATLLGSEFRTVRASQPRVESVAKLWKGSVRLAVSDRERTLADGLTNPEWVGGLRHLVEMLLIYRRSDHWNPEKLLAAVASNPKGATYKRLGYLTEAALGGNALIVQKSFDRKTSGIIRLDPQVKPTGKILSRWGLRLNVKLPTGDAS